MAWQQITPNVVRVLRAFIDDPGGDHYGYDLMHRLGMASGRMYPILAALEKNEVIESALEDANAKEVGRRPRRYYRITPNGLEYARKAVAEFYATVGARPSKGFGVPGVSPA